MHLGDHMPTLRNRIDHLPRHVTRMRCHIPDAFNAIDFIHFAKQIRKIRTVFKIKTIGIHILSQERDFFIACSGKFPYFFDNGLDRTTPFATAYIRHDAISAKLVAPLHDRHPGKNIAFTNGMQVRKVCNIGTAHLRFERVRGDRFTALQ